MISEIIHIERQAHLPHMRQMQNCRTWQDLAEYCEGTPDALVGNGWYVLACRDTREIVDLAAVIPLRFADMVRIVKWLGPGKWTADLRHDTSWPLVRAAERRGWCRVLKDSTWHWCGVKMHDVCVEVTALTPGV